MNKDWASEACVLANWKHWSLTHVSRPTKSADGPVWERDVILFSGEATSSGFRVEMSKWDECI